MAKREEVKQETLQDNSQLTETVLDKLAAAALPISKLRWEAAAGQQTVLHLWHPAQLPLANHTPSATRNRTPLSPAS